MYDYTNKELNIKNYTTYDLNRSVTMFKYSNLPDTIPEYNLEYILQTKGYAFITEIDDNLYALSGSLGGKVDVYGECTNITINNTGLNFNKTLDVNTDGVLIRNDFLKIGLLPLLERYNTQLVESDITIVMSSINNRLQTLISANDNRTLESAKEFLKALQNGKLGVIAEQQLFDSLKTFSTKQTNTNFKDLIELHQFIKASKYNEIGLSSIINMKKERLNVAEVESNTATLYPYVDNMLQCRKQALEKINSKYGLNIDIDFASSWNDRVNNDDEVSNGENENEQREEKSNNENN